MSYTTRSKSATKTGSAAARKKKGAVAAGVGRRNVKPCVIDDEDYLLTDLKGLAKEYGIVAGKKSKEVLCGEISDEHERRRRQSATKSGKTATAATQTKKATQAAAKKTPARKASARKTPVKKAPARKAPATRKTPAGKRTPAKKQPARKAGGPLSELSRDELQEMVKGLGYHKSSSIKKESARKLLNGELALNADNCVDLFDKDTLIELSKEHGLPYGKGQTKQKLCSNLLDKYGSRAKLSPKKAWVDVYDSEGSTSYDYTDSDGSEESAPTRRAGANKGKRAAGKKW